MSHFFNEAASVEHLEHVAHYESCQIKLGARYLLAFDEAMRVVCEAPDRYRIEFPPAIRKYRAPGFPYNVLYRIVDSDIEVLVVGRASSAAGLLVGQALTGRPRRMPGAPVDFNVKPQNKCCLMPIRFVHTPHIWSSLGQKRNLQRTSKPLVLTS